MYLQRRLIVAVAVFAVAFTSAASETNSYTPSPENLAAREWFQDAKFGVFLHWGLYSQLGAGGNMGIARMEAEQIAGRNDP